MGFVTTSSLTTTPFQTQDQPSGAKATDDTHEIGHLLFTQYVAPFEVTSLLILVATIGVIVLSKKEEASPREEIEREAPPIEPRREAALRR
jgi:NADH:ubiquinone oxidoreductase subunit 6 (subunit J)